MPIMGSMQHFLRQVWSYVQYQRRSSFKKTCCIFLRSTFSGEIAIEKLTDYVGDAEFFFVCEFIEFGFEVVIDGDA
jgi:hypothetical protein